MGSSRSHSSSLWKLSIINYSKSKSMTESRSSKKTKVLIVLLTWDWNHTDTNHFLVNLEIYVLSVRNFIVFWKIKILPDIEQNFLEL